MLGKELLNLKSSKLGQILRADKTGFRRLGHIYSLLTPRGVYIYKCLIIKRSSHVQAAL